MLPPAKQRCAPMGKPPFDVQLESSRALIERSKELLASTDRLVSRDRRFPELSENGHSGPASRQREDVSQEK